MTESHDNYPPYNSWVWGGVGWYLFTPYTPSHLRLFRETVQNDSYITVNIYWKSRNLPDTDVRNYSKDLRLFLIFWPMPPNKSSRGGCMALPPPPSHALSIYYINPNNFPCSLITKPLVSLNIFISFLKSLISREKKRSETPLWTCLSLLTYSLTHRLSLTA